VPGIYQGSLGLRDGGCQGRADVAECGVDGTRQLAHAGGSTEGDESDDQGVFDQVLTVLTVGQILELHKKLNEDVVHSGPSLLRYGIPSPEREV